MLIHPQPRELHAVHERRVTRLRREIHGGGHAPVRRWVGRQMVRLGARLAADSTLRPARSL